MKLIKKFLTSFLLVFFLLFSFQNAINIEKSTAKKELNPINLNKAESKSLIYIDDNDPNNNWAKYKEVSNCSGLGTLSDPYIIENELLEGWVVLNEEGNFVFNHENVIINVKNSEKHFVIKNCSLTYLGNYSYSCVLAIKFTNVINGIIMDNNISRNYYGIKLDICENILISGNRFNNNSNNILINGLFNEVSNNLIISCWKAVKVNGHNNIITKNEIKNCGDSIWLDFSDNNTILQNSLSDSLIGIILHSDCNYNDILNNTIKNNRVGIYIGLKFAEENKNNEISHNNITNNEDFGISLTLSTNAVVKHNEISENLQYGIKTYENASNSLIYKNRFVRNGINAFDEGKNNQWDNGTVGNFWSDVTLSETAMAQEQIPNYNISGGAGSVDRYPEYMGAFDRDTGEEAELSVYGYDFFALFAISFVVSVMIIRKTLKKKKN